MAGRALRGMLSTADYNGGKALKSCHTEFVHIYSAAFSHKREGLLEVLPFFFVYLPSKNKHTKTITVCHCQNSLA